MVFHDFFYFLAEMIVQVIMNEELVAVGEISFTMPPLVVYSAYIYIFATLMFLAFALFWKYIVVKKGYDLKILLLFAVFPVSQIVTVCIRHQPRHRRRCPRHRGQE